MATIVRRTLADGSTRWQAIIRRAGQSKKKQFRTKPAAAKWARQVETDIDAGKSLPGIDAERRTVADVLAAYEDSGSLDHLRAAEDRRRHLEWWEARLGTVRALALNKARIRAELRVLETGEAAPKGKPLAPSTRRRYLATLRAALTWAMDEELIPVNPARGAARRKDREPPGRVRYLDDEERAALLAEVDASTDPRLAPLVRLALLTGARQGELLGLRWRDLDLERGLASLPRTKAGPGRSVALSAPAVAILREQHSRRVVGLDQVFGVPPSGRAYFPRKAWEKAVDAAGLDDFRFHDLRHSFASALLSAGSTLAETAAALGHHTLQMVQRYQHLEAPHAARIVDRVADRLSG